MEDVNISRKDEPAEEYPRRLTTIIGHGDNWCVAHCPELGVVSQGRTEREACANLKEAVKQYLKKFWGGVRPDGEAGEQ